MCLCSFAIRRGNIDSSCRGGEGFRLNAKRSVLGLPLSAAPGVRGGPRNSSREPYPLGDGAAPSRSSRPERTNPTCLTRGLAARRPKWSIGCYSTGGLRRWQATRGCEKWQRWVVGWVATECQTIIWSCITCRARLLNQRLGCWKNHATNLSTKSTKEYRNLLSPSPFPPFFSKDELSNVYREGLFVEKKQNCPRYLDFPPGVPFLPLIGVNFLFGGLFSGIIAKH